MNKKLLAVVAVVCFVFSFGVPLISADVSTMTGTFNPTISMSGHVDNETFAWGSFASDANVTKVAVLFNDGDVNIDSTIHNDSYSGDLTFVALADNDAQDEFACIWSDDAGTWRNMGTVGTPLTLENDIPASGAGINESGFAVNVVANGVGWSQDWNEQSFDIKVTYVEHS